MSFADLVARVLAPWVEVPRKLDDLGATMAVTQADLDGIVGNLRSLREELTDSNSRIQTAIANLASNNPNLDLSEINAALSDLAATVDNTQAIVPETPGDGGVDQTPTDPGASSGDGSEPAPADPVSGEPTPADPAPERGDTV